MADGDTRDDPKLPPLDALPGPRTYLLVAAMPAMMHRDGLMVALAALALAARWD